MYKSKPDLAARERFEMALAEEYAQEILNWPRSAKNNLYCRFASGRMFNPGPVHKQERLKSQRRYHQILLETIESDRMLGQQMRWPEQSNWRFAFYGQMPLIRESGDWYADYPKALQQLAALADRERKAIHDLSAMIEQEHQCESFRLT
jgi:hypothetical protein